MVEKVGLHEQRLGAVLAQLKNSHARRVLDLGCGEGRLLALLLKDASFKEIVGLDISDQALDTAAARLRLDHLAPKQRQRITLVHGSLLNCDPRLIGFDAAAVVEVIEHLEPAALARFEHAIFEFAQPETIVITTPNAEYNVKWAAPSAGRFRHETHCFEWTRAEFARWGKQVAGRLGYIVRFLPVGPEDARVGAPSQMGVFSRV